MMQGPQLLEGLGVCLFLLFGVSYPLPYTYVETMSL